MTTDVTKLQGVRMERLFMTADLARKFLTTNIDNNRVINEARIREMGRDMAGGKWPENGDTFVFTGSGIDSPGKLIDGQHRLLACRECGVGFWAWIAWGVSEEAFATIDRGQSRSTGQVLHMMHGITDYNAVASTVVWLFRFRDGIMITKGRPTSLEIEELLNNNPGLIDSVAAARRVLHSFHAGPIAVVAICHYLFSRQDPVLAETFFDAIARGTGLRDVDGVYHLRNRILSAGQRHQPIDRTELMALYFKTWLAEREQRTVRMSPKWSIAEAFPNIGPVPGIYKLKLPSSPSSHAGTRRRKTVTPPLPRVQAKPLTRLDELSEKVNGRRLN